jgi:hypothetical protein
VTIDVIVIEEVIQSLSFTPILTLSTNGAATIQVGSILRDIARIRIKLRNGIWFGNLRHIHTIPQMIKLSINNSMTPKFDIWYEQLITEYTSKSGQRSKSRYSGPNKYTTLGNVRRISNKANRSDSQASKLGNHQYVGDIAGNGPRQNKSEKGVQQAGIAKGLGGYIKPEGGNPKKPGASVNSKQGNMLVKYVMGNGVAKVGAVHNQNYTKGKTERVHIDRFKKLYGN